jgi:DNA polymerase-3 subunit alpha
MDGLSRCREIAARAAADGHAHTAITDHGNCSGHPDFQRACDEYGISPVFGMEGYFIADRTEQPGPGDKEAQKRRRSYAHLILLARDNAGLRNLYSLSSEAYTSGFYAKPCLDWELLEKYGAGLTATTACLGGIISKPLLAGDWDTAAATLRRMRGIFGENFYLEVQPNLIPEQQRLNMLLKEVSASSGIPLAAASDAHYPSPAEESLHRTWMACQTGTGNDDYWQMDPMHDEAVVRDRLSRALGPDAARQACDNTVRIAEQCTARIGGEIVPPVFSSSYEEDSRALYQRASDALADRHSAGLLAGGSLDDYARRLGEEFCLVRDKRLSGCYLMVEDITTWARGEGILVGPGRGSAAGSLMSWLLDITVSDPIDAGLMFSRFLTPGRVSLPDFDLDFPSSQRGKIQDRVIGKYGADSVVRVGTHMRYRAKSVLDKLAGVAVSRGELPAEARTDMKAVSALIEEAESHTAGLGLPWDDLMSQLSDGLEPYVQKYPEIFSTAAVLVGRVRGYGTHPAGLVISTGQPLEGTLPMRIASAQDRTVVSQWDFRDMEAQGLLKLDFLTLRTLDSIQEAVRLIGQRTGHRPDPSRWTAEYRDPQVWEEIGTGRTLGMFQVETSLGARFCGDMKPRSIAELAHLVALVRPGPRNSGMDQAYLRRRAGKEEVQYPHPALEDRLRGQQGIMIFQEDILYACTELAGYDGAEADGVRKILGKKLTAKIAAAGEEFARRCEENGHISRKEAEDIWETMATFGKYGFNASHAFSYSVLAFWTGWLKSHYPAETLAAICTTLSEKEKDRIGLYVNEARRLGIDVRPPDVNHHARGFAVEWPRDGEESRPSVRYGLDAITGVGDSALKALAAGAPFASWDAVRGTVNSGVLRALVTGGALDALVPSRRALAEHLDADRAGDLVRCVHKDETVSGPNGLPCTYEWDKEPVIERLSERTGRRLQPLIKPPPARCTRSCRRYQPPDLSGLDGSLSYAPDVLWRLETGLFGTWLSPDAFTALDARLPGASRLGAELTDMWDDLPAGIYQVPAVFQGLRETVTKAGNTMGWLTLASVTGIIDISCFRPRDPGEPDLLAVAGRIRPGTPVAVLAERSRYRTSSGWRTSGRLRDIRSISAR